MGHRASEGLSYIYGYRGLYYLPGGGLVGFHGKCLLDGGGTLWTGLPL